MSIEYTLVQFEIALANPANQPATMAVSSRAWWSLSQIALGGLLLTYLVGCFQDFQRVRRVLAPLVRVDREQAEIIGPQPHGFLSVLQHDLPHRAFGRAHIFP